MTIHDLSPTARRPEASQRAHRRVRRSGAAIGVAVASVLLLPLTATAADEDLTAPWSGSGPGQTYCGVYTGTLFPLETGEHTCAIEGFMIGADVNGLPTAVYSTRGDAPAGDPSAVATSSTFPAAGSDLGDNEEAARRVLVNYYPNENPGLAEEYQTDGTDDQQAAAVQAVLWQLAGDYEMDLDTDPPDPTETDFVTYANYLHILQAVEDNALPAGEEGLSVHILAPTDGVLTSFIVGPFTVTTNGSVVTVVPPANVDLVSASGDPVGSEYADGEQFYLQFPGLGDYTIDSTTVGIQDAQVEAWTTEDRGGDPLTPLAAASSRNGTYTERLEYTVYEITAPAADPVEVEPAFTG